MPCNPQEILEEISQLDFTGKGEAFVEARFITPLLEALGYETHRDYEVIRHGDSGSIFKLRYPPVEGGAKSVRRYNPDFIPTIRKKTFWIVEAKTALECKSGALSGALSGARFLVTPTPATHARPRRSAAPRRGPSTSNKENETAAVCAGVVAWQIGGVLGSSTAP